MSSKMTIYHLEEILKYVCGSFLGDGFLSAHLQVTGNMDGYSRKHYASRTTVALKSHTKHNRSQSYTHRHPDDFLRLIAREGQQDKGIKGVRQCAVTGYRWTRTI